MFYLLSPAAGVKQRPAEQISRLYPLYRIRILASTFYGYAIFYLVRNNLSTVAKDMGTALHYDKPMIGDILAITAITYGVGKLFMGALSDRSDARKFMSLGLLMTALCNFGFGSVQSYPLHLTLWALNGFIQGMGWGPCGRSLGHWYSVKERGTVFAFWNVSHNIGGALAGVVAAYSAHAWGWNYAFFIPGLIALFSSAVLFLSLVDTPQSVGLPPIETYANVSGNSKERELTLKEIFIEHLLKNRLLWFVAFANFFVYIARYSMLDWGPIYLREVKGADIHQGGWGIFLNEISGVPSTILVGWFSDRMGGRRGLISMACMIPVFFAFAGILINPPGNLQMDMMLLGMVGFFVYPPVMLLGVMALDLAGKKAVGAAAGLVGLFGYLGRTFQAKGLGYLAEHHGWDSVLVSILICVGLAIVLLLPTTKVKPR